MKRKESTNEWWAELNADPKYIARRVRDEQELQRQLEHLRRAQEPLIAALSSVGLTVKSVWDLVNTSVPYPKALPILLDHLTRPYPDRVREGIARSLAVRDSRFAWEKLFELYQQEHGEGAKDGLAIALGVIADEDVIAQVVALVYDKQNGPSRIFLLRALKKSKDPRSLRALTDLRDDPDLKVEVEKILRQLMQSRRRVRSKS